MNWLCVTSTRSTSYNDTQGEGDINLTGKVLKTDNMSNEELHEEIANRRSQLIEVYRKISKLQLQLDEVEMNNKELRKEAEMYKGLLDKLEGKYNSEAGSVGDLKERVRKLNYELETAHKDIDWRDAELELLREQLAALQSKGVKVKHDNKRKSIFGNKNTPSITIDNPGGTLQMYQTKEMALRNRLESRINELEAQLARYNTFQRSNSIGSEVGDFSDLISNFDSVKIKRTENGRVRHASKLNAEVRIKELYSVSVLLKRATNLGFNTLDEIPTAIVECKMENHGGIRHSIPTQGHNPQWHQHFRWTCQPDRTTKITFWVRDKNTSEVLGTAHLHMPELLKQLHHKDADHQTIASFDDKLKLLMKAEDSGNKWTGDLYIHVTVSIVPELTMLFNKGYGHEDIADILMYTNVNLNQLDRSQQTALDRSVMRNNPDAIVTLLKAGASPEAKNIDGLTPLHVACAHGHFRAARALLAHGADKHSFDEFKSTPLHHAAINDSNECVNLLLENDVNVNAVDLHHNTPLISAAFNGSNTVIKTLVEASCDIDFQEKGGVSAVIAACIHDNSKTLQLLLENRADPNKRDDKGMTPLMVCAFNNAIESTNILLQYRANVEAVNHYRTSLMWAANMGRYEICKLLVIDGHASPDVVDDQGRTAAIIAMNNGYQKLSQEPWLQPEHSVSALHGHDAEHHLYDMYA